MPSKDLKITFSGDSKSYRQEMDKANLATNKLQKDAGSAMSSLAAVFGVNIGDIKDKIDGMSKTFTLLHTSMKASAAGATIFQGAMKIVKIATIASGIGALVVVVGSLIAYFTQTREGANFVKTALAALGAVVRVGVDAFSSLGDTIINAFKNPKETIVELRDFIISQFVNRIAAIPLLIESAWKIVKGIFNGSAGDAAKDFAIAMAQFGTGLDKEQQKKVITYVKVKVTEGIDDGKAAAELERRTQALAAKERVDEVENSEKRRRIDELRRDAKDKETFTDEQRLGFLKQARVLMKEVATDEIGDAIENLSIHQGKMKLHKESTAELEKQKELRMRINEIAGQAATEEKGLLRETIMVTKAVKERADQAARALAMGGTPLAMKMKTDATVTTTYKTKTSELANIDPSMAILGKQAKIIQTEDDIANHTIDMSSAVQGAFGDMGASLGKFLGDLMTGKGNIADFGSAVAGAFADLAITVGKQMIAFGVAGTVLKLLTKKPELALMAGIALVALGTAAKNAISSSLSGGGATGAASSTGGGYEYDARQSASASKMQTINVVVTGELKAQGGALVTVLNQENQRKAIVT